VFEDPIERRDCGINFEHKVSPNVVNAMLVMPSVHIRYILLLRLDIRQNVDIMILSDVMQAVDSMSSRCCG
jgi:hypothetical protein